MIPDRASCAKLAWLIALRSHSRMGVVVLFAVCWFNHITVGGEIYQRFLDSFDTNDLRAFVIRSPQLVDTNNISSKLTNAVLSLSRCMADKEVPGIRLGMTMEEVVAKWGKPKFMWPYCYGGPRFAYSDTDVIFEPGSNSVMRIIIQKLPRLEADLSTSSSMEDCIRILGPPTLRTAYKDSGFSYLHYATSSQCTLVMDFVDGDLHRLFLERPGLRLAPKK